MHVPSRWGHRGRNTAAGQGRPCGHGSTSMEGTMSRGSVWSRGIRRAENKQGPRRSLRKRCIASASGLVAAAALVAPAGSAASAAEPVLTDFALAANGFSTQVTGGALPVESGRTGSVGLSCTRFAGRTNTNNTAAVGIPARRSLVRVGVTTSRAYTTTEGDTVSSNGVNNVASVLIRSKAVAGLVIRGIRTRTRVWHDSAGFHREQVITVAGVTRYVGGEGERGRDPDQPEPQGPAPQAPRPSHDQLRDQSGLRFRQPRRGQDKGPPHRNHRHWD